MDKIEELLTRGVDKIYPAKEDLGKILKSGKKLRIYQGFDPTSPELHLGHLVGLRKLAQWQKLGHEVIFLIGDFTGMIGDPTGKDATRKVLTKEEVLENAKTYKEQASKVLEFEGDNPVLIKYNSEWLSKLSAIELIELSRNLSLQQVMERDMFQRRLKNNMDVALSEFFYPFMQGYDSVAMDVDVEVGGTDQMFNMLMGRTLMHKLKRKDKFVMTTPILEDSAGKKIGKTEGNVIALNDSPVNFYRKIMGLGDDIILKGLEYLTNVPAQEISEVKRALDDGENPINFKKKLAFEVTKELNGEEKARKAEEEFERTVQNKELPGEIKRYTFDIPELNILDILMHTGLAESKSGAKRLIEQGGVTIDGNFIKSPDEVVKLKDERIIKVGKKNFAKLKLIER
ncbi:MAG: tyrosine--tRNA ligase [Patescibacteria group bacterium]|nr:tyrosine--tRNA ligase [Patescibacteria group bacterium]